MTLTFVTARKAVVGAVMTLTDDATMYSSDEPFGVARPKIRRRPGIQLGTHLGMNK